MVCSKLHRFIPHLHHVNDCAKFVETRYMRSEKACRNKNHVWENLQEENMPEVLLRTLWMVSHHPSAVSGQSPFQAYRQPWNWDTKSSSCCMEMPHWRTMASAKRPSSRSASPEGLKWHVSLLSLNVPSHLETTRIPARTSAPEPAVTSWTLFLLVCGCLALNKSTISRIDSSVWGSIFWRGEWLSRLSREMPEPEMYSSNMGGYPNIQCQIRHQPVADVGTWLFDYWVWLLRDGYSKAGYRHRPVVDVGIWHWMLDRLFDYWVWLLRDGYSKAGSRHRPRPLVDVGIWHWMLGYWVAIPTSNVHHWSMSGLDFLTIEYDF